jgi:CubicO group peptidase (beta-lactamase class C family)
MQIVELARAAIEKKVFPGCVVGVIGKGGRKALPFGRPTYADDSSVVIEESLYDCASLTKSVVTATLALQLLDEGKFSLESRLTEFIPEYRTRHRETVTIRHLLTYTLGNTAPLASLKEKTSEEIFAAVCIEETHEPGTVFNYSNTPAFLLGVAIERMFAMPLDKAAQKHILDPLGMKSATFSPHGAVSTEEGVQDIVHDESARVFSRAGKTVGHAGLFATVNDLLTFIEHLLNNPDRRLCTNQIAHLNASTALGWELNQAHFMGSKRTPQMFGKTGFTGTSVVCDFNRQTSLIILSNRTYPKRPHDTSTIANFRNTACDIVFA